MIDASAVMDTNVFVAAGFNTRSASARIIDAIRRRQIRMIWNKATRREIDLIVNRIPPLRKLDFSDLFVPVDEYLGPVDPARFSDIPDPDDWKFAALAHAAGVPLVSNDSHLLDQREHHDLIVLTPGEYWGRHVGSEPYDSS